MNKFRRRNVAAKPSCVLLIARECYSTEGGIQRVNRRTARALAQFASDGSVDAAIAICLKDKQDDIALQAPQGIRVVGLQRLGKAGGVRRYARQLGHAARLFNEIFQVSRTYDVRAVVLDFISLAPIVTFLRLVVPRARVLLFAHGVEVWSRPGLATRLGIKLTHRILPVSSYTRDRLLEWAPVMPSSRLVVPCAVDIQDEPKFERSGTNILTVSRLESIARDKNIDSIIAAMETVAESFPDAQLTIVGAGNRLQELRDIAEALGQSKRVRFTGQVDDQSRQQLYDEATIFVLPSTREGFGIVYIEAWTRGLAVIAGNDGAAPETVRHEVDGLCVSPEPSAVGQAIIRLLADADLRASFARSGYERSKSAFGHEQFVARMGTVLFDNAPTNTPIAIH